MPVLHIVNKSPFERKSLDTCLRLSKADSAILLIEDAVYAVSNTASTSITLLQALGQHPVYALQPDLQARGIDPDHTIEGIELVDYDGFVRLTTEYDKLQSWL